MLTSRRLFSTLRAIPLSVFCAVTPSGIESSTSPIATFESPSITFPFPPFAESITAFVILSSILPFAVTSAVPVISTEIASFGIEETTPIPAAEAIQPSIINTAAMVASILPTFAIVLIFLFIPFSIKSAPNLIRKLFNVYR